MKNFIPNDKLTKVRLLCAGVILLGVADLIGWGFDIPQLRSVLPGLPSLKVNAAICFILLGSSLVLLTQNAASKSVVLVSGVCATTSVLIGLVTLLEYALDWDAGIDQMFFVEPTGMTFTASPGRMAVIAAVMIVMQGISLLLIVFQSSYLVTQIVALLSGLIALLSIVGYMFGNLLFLRIGSSSGIAAHAALGFLAMAAGILYATAHQGFLVRLQPRFDAINTVFSLGLLAISIAAMTHSILQSQSAGVLVQETYALLGRSENLQSLSFEYQAVTRSYLLTGNEALLAESIKIRQTTFDHLDELQQLTAGSGLSVDSLNGIHGQLKTLFSSSDNLVTTRKDHGLSAVAQKAGEGVADRLHAAILNQLKVYEADIQRQLQARQKLLELKNGIAKVTLATFMIIGLSLLLSTFKSLRREISQRQQAEQRWRFALEGAGDGVWDWDIKADQAFYSDRWKQILGLTHDAKSQGMSIWADRIHPEDRIAVLNIMQDYFDGKTNNYVSEHRVVCKDGESKWVHEQGLLVSHDAAGQPLRMIGTLKDITEQKQLEIAAKQFEAIVRSSSDAIISKTLDGIVTSWNPGAEELFGYTAQEMIGQLMARLFPVDQFGEEKDILARIARGEAVEHFETSRVHKSGQLLHVSMTISPIRDETGKIIGVSNVARDITERKRLETELIRYKDHLEDEVQLRTADLVLARNEAEAANKAKSIFLANMSHELRTPLNAILGFSSLLRKQAQLPSAQRDYLDIINRSGEHLLNLINDVLEMSKIESGRVVLHPVPIDLGGMVRDVMAMMNARAKEKGLKLIIDQSSQVPRFIKGDEARLRQVLINLVGNAVKFTEQGGVSLRLGTRHNNVSHLMIEVEDSGVGIAAEDLPRLFQPFVQLGKQVADNKGTGLGLTLVRQYLQLMGGSIKVESTVGKGSIFRVDLPIERVEAAAEELSNIETLIQGDVIGLAPGQPTFRVLIVEDQRDNQLLLSQLMTSVGFLTMVAENGERGVELFQSWKPHLIWMDRRMPGMDGIEATKVIRKLPGGNNVKIVAVTASAFIEQRQEMLDAGMDDLVRKPYRFNEIYECLARQLEVRYIYADTQPKCEVNATQLTPQMLSMLPAELQQELSDSLQSLVDDRIAQAIEKVAAYDVVLHKTLAFLIENFDYPAILNALQANHTDNQHDQ